MQDETIASPGGPDEEEAVRSGRIDSERLAHLARLVSREEGAREDMPVSAPFTGNRIGTIPACTEADLSGALRRGREAQSGWAQLTAASRSAVFLRFHDLVLARQEEILDLLQFEGGKARHHALEEVLDIAITCRHYAVHAGDYLRPERRQGALPGLTATTVHHHPLGVIGIISPWNYPFSLALCDAIPALLAGNAVVLKPDSRTPFSALLGLELLHTAGLPQGLLQIVTGYPEEIGSPLIAGTDAVCFTGSTATGRIIAREAGEQLRKCSLELGGKNAMLVLDDAHLERSVEGALRGCFANAGQLCMSFERLYLQDGIHDRFLDAFVARARSLRLGKGLDYRADMGSLISASQLATVERHVNDAVARGATVLAGGHPRPDIGPFFFEPTILSGVTPEMTLHREETFGPVVAVYRFATPEEAVSLANDSPYGLNASVWTRNTGLGRALALRIRCGTVNINESYAAAWGSVAAPMGGMKASGIGRRHGAEGILKYTEAQTVAAQRLLPIAPLPGMERERYARIMTRLLALVRRLPGMR